MYCRHRETDRQTDRRTDGLASWHKLQMYILHLELKIQEGGGGRLDNLKNRNISATDLLILTKFGLVMLLGPRNPVSQYNFANSKIQDDCDGHLRNRKVAISPQWMDQFRVRQGLAWWRASVLQTPLQIWCSCMKGTLNYDPGTKPVWIGFDWRE